MKFQNSWQQVLNQAWGPSQRHRSPVGLHQLHPWSWTWFLFSVGWVHIFKMKYWTFYGSWKPLPSFLYPFSTSLCPHRIFSPPRISLLVVNKFLSHHPHCLKCLWQEYSCILSLSSKAASSVGIALVLPEGLRPLLSCLSSWLNNVIVIYCITIACRSMSPRL